jgi:hypothetical protein
LVTIGRPQKESIDVAIVELRDRETIARLKAGWQFLTLDSVRAPHEHGVFILAGFPVELATSADGKVTGPLAAVFSERTTRVPQEAREPVESSLDLFFHYDRDGVGLDGSPFKAPSLKGTSGGGVWEYQPRVQGLWSPAKAVKVVGVQSSLLAGGYFRAKHWGAVAEVFRQFDPELASAIYDEVIE